MKLFLFTLIVATFWCAHSLGLSCPAAVIRASDMHTNPYLLFGFERPFLERKPKVAEQLKLTQQEREEILSTYKTAVEKVEAWDDGDAILLAMGNYYKAHLAIANARYAALEKAVEASSGVDEARAQCLLIEKERIVLASVLSGLMGRLQAPANSPDWDWVHKQKLQAAFRILSWEGLEPELTEIKYGGETYQGITWKDDGNTELGSLVTEMNNFEPGRKYIVTYSPKMSDTAGGSAMITSEQSPIKPDILCVSSRAIAGLKIDTSVEHEIRHAEVFRLIGERKDSGLLAHYLSISRPLPRVNADVSGYHSADEQYTLLANVKNYATDSLEDFLAGDKDGAYSNLSNLNFFAVNGLVTSEQLLGLYKESKQTLNIVRKEFDSTTGLALKDTLEITDTHENTRTVYQVGPNENHLIGFEVRKNLRGEDYVEVSVTHKGIAGFFVLLDKDLVPLVKAFHAEAKRDGGKPELTPGFEKLLAALDKSIQNTALAAIQYHRFYERIHKAAYALMNSTIEEEPLRALHREAMRASDFTTTSVPEIQQ